MNNLGYVYTSGDPERLGDVLTWHDQGEFRVWVHSKAVLSGREIVSVEVQAIDDNALKPSKEEQSLRLRLCAKRSVPKGWSLQGNNLPNTSDGTTFGRTFFFGLQNY